MPNNMAKVTMTTDKIAKDLGSRHFCKNLTAGAIMNDNSTASKTGIRMGWPKYKIAQTARKMTSAFMVVLPYSGSNIGSLKTRAASGRMDIIPSCVRATIQPESAELKR